MLISSDNSLVVGLFLPLRTARRSVDSAVANFALKMNCAKMSGIENQELLTCDTLSPVGITSHHGVIAQLHRLSNFRRKIRYEGFETFYQFSNIICQRKSFSIQNKDRLDCFLRGLLSIKTEVLKIDLICFGKMASSQATARCATSDSVTTRRSRAIPPRRTRR